MPRSLKPEVRACFERAVKKALGREGWKDPVQEWLTQATEDFFADLEATLPKQSLEVVASTFDLGALFESGVRACKMAVRDFKKKKSESDAVDVFERHFVLKNQPKLF